jgi:hypothetical protein
VQDFRFSICDHFVKLHWFCEICFNVCIINGIIYGSLGLVVILFIKKKKKSSVVGSRPIQGVLNISQIGPKLIQNRLG